VSLIFSLSHSYSCAHVKPFLVSLSPIVESSFCVTSKQCSAYLRPKIGILVLRSPIERYDNAYTK